MNKYYEIILEKKENENTNYPDLTNSYGIYVLKYTIPLRYVKL